jgi:hypothetical protein
LQAEINEVVLEDLHGKELEDWIQFGKIREAEESDYETQTTFLSMPRNESENSAKNLRNNL